MLSSRNIPLMYLVKFCKGLLFSVSITYLFYNSYNLGTTELYIVQAIFALGVVFFEIPTGFISDKYSRKASLVIGLLFGAIGFGVYSQSSTIWGFIIAELILVIGFCCISGSDTSLLYDTMIHDKKSSEYKIVSGRYFGIGSLAEGIGGISGAYIAVYGFEIPFILDGVFAFVAFMIALFLIEPPREKLDPLEGSRSQVRQIFFTVYHHKKVWRLIVFSALVGAMTINMVWFSQPYMKLVDLPIIYIGRFWFAMNASGSVINLFIHKIEQYLTEKVFMIAIVIWGVICMMTLAFFPSIRLMPVFFLFQLSRQGNRLISNDNLHILTSSSIRATVQSISSMMFRLCFAVWGPIFGYVYTHAGLVPALGASSVVLGGLAVYARWSFWKRNSASLYPGPYSG